MRELHDKLSNYQVLIGDVVYQAYHTRGVITCSRQLFFLVFHYLFTISESKNCRFCYSCSFMCFSLYDEPFWKNKNIFVFLMWAVCWSDKNEISLTTCSAGPHYANIILDIFGYLRYILYTYPSGVGCFVIFSCLVVTLTFFVVYFVLLMLFLI